MLSLRFPYALKTVARVSYGVMASWVLRCAKCKNPFVHSAIMGERVLDYFFPLKPEFPAGGSELKCPKCEHLDVYQRTDLLYRA